LTVALSTRELVGAVSLLSLEKAPNRYIVTPLATPAEIEAIAGEWSELERRCARPIFFQSATWSMLACRVFADLQGTSFAPLVLAVRRGPELVAVAPLRVVRRGPLRLAVDLTDPFGQYGDVLIADDADAETIVSEIIVALRATNRVDALLMRRVRADSPVRSVLGRGGFEASAHDGAPFVDFRAFPTFESYHGTVNAKSRKNLRNLRNRLARVGAVTSRVFSVEEIDQAIELSLAGRLRWLDEQGLTSTAFDDPAFRTFVERVAELGRRGEIPLLAMGLYCGDVPVSLQWGFVHGGRYYAYVAARNPEFDAYSGGRLHLEDVVHTCHGRGIAVCDFLAPAVRYKLTWTDEVTPVVDVAFPFSIMGRVVLDVWNRRLRVTAKKYYSRLPASLRRVVRQTLAPRGPA
jgi:CelD/BcsL family acetyltransferase involved in cellulose biosynthesis